MADFMFDGVGMNSNFALALESTYGTLASGTFEYDRLISETLKLNPSVKFYPGMSGPGRIGKYLGFQRVSGDIVVEGKFEGAVLQLLEAAIGTSTPTGSGPYTHTFTMDKTLGSYSMEIMKGNIPDGKCFLYKGCVVNTLQLDLANEEILKVTAGIIAQDRDTNATPDDSTPSYAAESLCALYYYSGTMTVAGTSGVVIKNVVLNVNNNLDGDRFFMSRLLSRPKRKTWREVTGTAVAVFDSIALCDKLKTGSQGVFAFVITSVDDIPAYPGSKYIMNITMSASVLTDADPVVNTEGELELPISFQAIGEDNEFAIAVTNGQPTVP